MLVRTCLPGHMYAFLAHVYLPEHVCFPSKCAFPHVCLPVHRYPSVLCVQLHSGMCQLHHTCLFAVADPVAPLYLITSLLGLLDFLAASTCTGTTSGTGPSTAVSSLPRSAAC